MARSVARPDEIRRHNLSLLLDQINRDGDLSRAELTQRLGLSRSTTGALVADLADLGLVNERIPLARGRADRRSPVVGPRPDGPSAYPLDGRGLSRSDKSIGRPSHVVGPRPDGPFAYAVDIEVDRVVGAAVGLGGRVLSRSETPVGARSRSPRGVSDLVACGLAQLVADLPSGSWPVGVGVSVPGTVRRDAGHVEFAPNLHWEDVDLAQLLTARLPAGLPVSIGNDADMGALAEHARGAGRGRDELIYLNGKIGVGGGLITGGNPLTGHSGLAGEVGHMMLDASGPPCRCGGRGCVETYIGEQALLRLAGRSGPPTRESVAEVVAAARAGEPRALNGVRAVGVSLGRIAANLVNLLNPQVVIMGGSLAAVLDIARPEIEVEMHRSAMAASRRGVELCTPGLAGDSCLLGAADLAFRALLGDPVAGGQLRPVA